MTAMQQDEVGTEDGCGTLLPILRGLAVVAAFGAAMGAIMVLLLGLAFVLIPEAAMEGFNFWLAVVVWVAEHPLMMIVLAFVAFVNWVAACEYLDVESRQLRRMIDEFLDHAPDRIGDLLWFYVNQIRTDTHHRAA